METSDLKKYVAELIGTFVLVLGGCGAAVLAGQYIGFLGVAFAFGLAVLVMVYAIGHISGCHINPAITVAMRVAGKITTKDTVFYIVFQCVGAILAAAVLALIVTGQDGGYALTENGLAQNGYGSESTGGYSVLACFVTELVLTALFLLVIFPSVRKGAPAGFAGLSIGLSLVLIHLIAIPVTNTSVNPARSTGPAVFVGGWALGQLWLFWVAPIVGALLAGLAYRYLFEEQRATAA